MAGHFLIDAFDLLRWSFFQPRKVAAQMQTLHPDLTSQTGLSQQLWLAGRNPPVRRFVGLQITAWLLMGLLSFGLMFTIRVILGPSLSLTWAELSTDALLFLLGVLGSVLVGVTLCMMGGVVVGVAGSGAGGVILGLSLGLALGLGQGGAAGAALGVSGGLILGTVAPIFDRLRRPAAGLSSASYWGRALMGLIFTAASIMLLGLILVPVFGLTLAVPFGQLEQLLIGAGVGLVGGFFLLIGTGLDMRLESGRWKRQALKWAVVDSLLLGLTGGIAASLVLGSSPGLVQVIALMVLWAVMVGGGGGVAMQVGNGVSATLTAAGLTWLLSAGFDTLFAQPVLLVVGITLLMGLYSYVRLPVALIEVPLARWQYLQLLRRPEKVLPLLRRTPVYWDDLIFYPLPALDQFLLRALRADREAGLREAAFIAQSFRQGWAANRARLTFTAEILAGCDGVPAIARAPAELEWLADETMKTLGQGTAEIVPRLLVIASGVRGALNADNPYSRRLGYREALDGLDMLRNRLLSLGAEAVVWWQPVIDRWQQVLLNDLEKTITATVTSTENPYQPGNPLPLTRKALFKGRQALREAVVNALLERNRPTLVLHGPRRMGKTSFLLQLPALLPGNTLPVFLDLQRPTATQNTAAFFYYIVRAISRDARPYRLTIEAPRRDAFTASPFEAFAAWLEDVALPALQDFNLLLTFDEFEKLGEAVQSGRLEERVFDELRYLIQHQSQLALLFAGVQSLDELGPAWSSYFINIKPLTIDYLTPEQAEALIRRPDPGLEFNLTYPQAVVEQLIAETGGHPYLLQLLCSAIVEESNAAQTLTIDASLVARAIPRALDQGEPYFRNIWDEMAGPEGRDPLRRIAEADSPLPLPDSPALRRLLRRRVITRDGAGYRVEIPLVRRWVVERAPT